VLFTAYLTIGGAIAGSADAVSVKAAKTALGGLIPVVGGIIADASETLLLGAAVIKNAVGVFGLLVVLGIVLQPCVSLAVRALCLKLGAALAGTFGGEELARYIDSLTGLYSMMLGLVSASAFLLVISIVSTILAGS
jgi:stage III sporulation protein AE